MIYHIKKKELTLGNKYLIKDEHKKKCYLAKGKNMTIGNKIRLTNLEGDELYYIEQQKGFKISPNYKIYTDGCQVADIITKFHKGVSSFQVEVSCKYGVLQLGSNQRDQYYIVQNNQLLVLMKKKYFTLGNSYSVDIIDNIDNTLMLSMCIIIDLLITDLVNFHHILP